MIAFIGRQDKLFLIEEQIKNVSFELINDTFDISVVVNRLKNASHYTQIIVDVDVLNNTQLEIANGLYLLKSVNNTNLVVIAQGYDVGDELLSELVANGVYNLVLSFDKEAALAEIATCFDGIELDEVRHFVNVSQLDERSLFRFKKRNIPNLKIGFAGITSRIGTTTQAMRLVKSLVEGGFTACYCEQNMNSHMEVIRNIFHSVKYHGGYIEYKNLHIFYKSLPSTTAYNYIICDYGTDVERLRECDLKVVVAGSTPWEICKLHPVIQEFEHQTNTMYLFSFTGKAEQDDILDFMGTKWSNTYFTEYSPDMFAEITLEEKDLYGRIINTRQSVVSRITPIAPTKKSGFFKRG